MTAGRKKSVHHDLPPLITEEIVMKVGDSGKISREKETALVPLLAKQRDKLRRRRRKKRGVDVLFKKATNKLWRSAMHVNRAVTLVHCQRLKEGNYQARFKTDLSGRTVFLWNQYLWKLNCWRVVCQKCLRSIKVTSLKVRLTSSVRPQKVTYYCSSSTTQVESKPMSSAFLL